MQGAAGFRAGVVGWAAVAVEGRLVCGSGIVRIVSHVAVAVAGSGLVCESGAVTGVISQAAVAVAESGL